MKEDRKSVFARLYPGENPDRKYQEYQNKKKKLIGKVMAVGIVSCICLQLCSRLPDRLQEGTRLLKNEWGEGSYTVVLSARMGDEEATLDYQVKERALTGQELERYAASAMEILPTVILGENEQLEAVSKNLNLCRELEGYPFRISWKSSNYERISSDGRVENEGLTPEGCQVLLTAWLSCQEESWEQEIAVTVVPEATGREQQLAAALEDFLAKQEEENPSKKELALPAAWEGTALRWKELKEDNSVWVLLLFLTGSVLLSFGMDRDLEKREQDRRRELEEEYPEFISKLQLYLGAGLTVRNAFYRIGENYENEKKQTGKQRFLYEELLAACHQLANGKPELAVYQDWSSRCETMSYRKLGFLLNSYLKQGNDRLLELLAREADLAFEERRNNARKKGEEAGTRLLLPMILMLMDVMLLILLPVFISFGGL